jgi:hypothetical protein
VVLVLATAVFIADADIYMHAPRGSNNRACRNDNGENRRNDNRLFDSQNNAKGGYSCPRAYPFACYKFDQGSAEHTACQAQNTVNPNKAMVNENGDLTNPQATNTPMMYYHVGSILEVEWTVQHGSGENPNVNAEIILQAA